jgi:perosamine synthetase
MTRLIPRFAVPYGPTAFAHGCLATLSGGTRSPLGLEAVFGDREMVWTGSGRQALYLMLRALNERPGAKVAVPLLTSGSVISTVRAAGCEPFFLDIDPRTLTVDPNEIRRAQSQVAAIVVVHLFGSVADMDRVMDQAGGVPVIEDTAQSFMSFWRGRPTGTFGIGSFYSFASSKCIPAGGGGLAAINDANLASRVRDLAATLTPRGMLDSFRCAAMQLVKAALFSRVLYGLVGNRMRTTAEERGFLLAKVDSRAITASSIAAVRSLGAHLEQRMRRQHENSLKLIALLRGAKGVVLPEEPPGAHYGYMLFPVLVADEEERDAVRQTMFRLGVDTSRVHYNCVETAVQHGYAGGCPVSEDVARRLLTLPNFAALKPQDLERVACAFLTALDRHRAYAPTIPATRAKGNGLPGRSRRRSGPDRGPGLDELDEESGDARSCTDTIGATDQQPDFCPTSPILQT